MNYFSELNHLSLISFPVCLNILIGVRLMQFDQITVLFELPGLVGFILCVFVLDSNKSGFYNLRLVKTLYCYSVLLYEYMYILTRYTYVQCPIEACIYCTRTNTSTYILLYFIFLLYSCCTRCFCFNFFKFSNSIVKKSCCKIKTANYIILLV